jgi:hypothetical protein
MRTKVEQKNECKKLNNEQNKLTTIIKSSNNNKIIHNIHNWHMNTMHNINKSQVSLLKRLKCDRPGIVQS